MPTEEETVCVLLGFMLGMSVCGIALGVTHIVAMSIGQRELAIFSGIAFGSIAFVMLVVFVAACGVGIRRNMKRKRSAL